MHPNLRYWTGETVKNHGKSGSNIYPRLEPQTSLKQRRFVMYPTAKFYLKSVV